MKLRNVQEAEAALRPYVPLVKQLTGRDLTLRRMEPLMRHIGNPEERLKAIHVAGTSGKTSTACYVAALLGAAGKRVGLTVSPHIDHITERVQVDGRPLTEQEFCDELGEFLDLVEQLETKPSYFELLCAFALWKFDRQSVDYAVVEVGLGGLQDATNVIDRPDKICVVTDIGLDHTHILGDTLPAIARQKIGIVHRGNQVLTYRQTPEIMEVFKDWTEEQEVSLQVVDEAEEQKTYRSLMVPDLAPYQRHNWLLAYGTYRAVATRDGLEPLSKSTLQATQRIVIPGRMEVLTIRGKTVVMDGAHNRQKMSALVSSFRKLYPGERPAVVAAFKTGKDYRPDVPLLAGLARRVVVTSFRVDQDLALESLPPEEVSEAFRAAGAAQVSVVSEPMAAFEQALNGPEKIILVTGSFYLLSQIRNNEAYVSLHRRH